MYKYNINNTVAVRRRFRKRLQKLCICLMKTGLLG